MKNANIDDDYIPVAQVWPKACSCCGNFFTHSDWKNLKFIGIQKSHDVNDYPDLELRNCDVCNSTLAIVVVR